MKRPVTAPSPVRQKAELRGRPPLRLSTDVRRLSERPVSWTDVAIRASTPHLTTIRQNCDTKVQQLMRSTRNGTKEGLRKTTLAMIRRVAFLQRKNSTGEGNEDTGYLEVSICELKHPPAQLCPTPEGLSSQQVIRRLILSSIVQSESSYLDSLKRILQEYQKPLLESHSSILNPEKVHQIFFRLKEIHQCHSMFQIALASRVSDWDQSEMIGDLFVASFSKSMVQSVYRDYINNFTKAMALIKKACVSRPAFLDFLKRKQASSADRITLYGLMVKPIQRFPQFILLLQDMLKNTPLAHKDRLPLQLALTELEILAEKLNEERRLADQDAEIQQLSHSVGDRTLNKLLNSEQRQLIHCELLTETVYGDKGQVLKSKRRKLFLFSDFLICANVTWKGPPEISSLVPLGAKCSVKWCAPLAQIQVEEVGQDGVAMSRRQSSASNTAGRMFLGPPRLFQDLEELQHDLAVVEEVSLLVGTLHGLYQNLNSTVSQDWCCALQRLIRLKEEQIQDANKCCLRLSIPGRPDRSGRPVSIMVVFNTLSPHSKISWVNRIYLAKLAQRKENSPGWECHEDDCRTQALFGAPLLTCSLPVLSSRTHSLTLEAALHSPSQSTLLGLCSTTTCLPQGYLWVAGGGGGSLHGQVDIFSLNRTTPRLVKSVPLRSSVLCLELVKESGPQTEEEEEEEAGRVTRAGNIICVGLQDGSIHVHSSVDTAVETLQTLVTPDGCPVLCLRHSPSFLFAGLASGKVAVFQRGAGERLWDVDSCRLVLLGSQPVHALLAVEDGVWASCGHHVSVIQGESLHTQVLEVHHDPGCRVRCMVRSGAGVWMAFTQESSIQLFHTETLELLQEVNISARSRHPGQLTVSCMLICQGLLWVGTDQGVILTFPVPTLEGIPRITGKGRTSLNAHCGPVDFLVSASRTLVPDFLSRGPVLSSSPDGEAGAEESSSQDPEAPPLKGLLLQYRVTSSSQLPGKLLSAQPPQDGGRTPPDLPEHRPEDGSIYEVNEDPDVWMRGRAVGVGDEREAKRSRMTSTAVFSGGRGVRRTEGSDSAENATQNTLLVWQLPLMLSQ
uniref:Rho guanine nucleotide exchange factor (GEF) 10-like b n=1 Tax=Oryzias melastigma TaxID=30732 RepID=A0A3B3CQD8_ORYME